MVNLQALDPCIIPIIPIGLFRVHDDDPVYGIGLFPQALQQAIESFLRFIYRNDYVYGPVFPLYFFHLYFPLLSLFPRQ